MKERFVHLYMDFAHRLAQMSYAERLKVGAIIVKNDRIISMSWNGTVSGWDNNCENRIYWNGEFMDMVSNEVVELIENKFPLVDSTKGDDFSARYRLVTKPEVIHAEINAIFKLAKDGESGEGASIFCTHACCTECAKGILQTGISEFYYNHDYRDRHGLELLERSGKVKVIKV